MRDRHALRDEIKDTGDAESLIAGETDNLMVLMDAAGNITWVNHAFVLMAGYSERRNQPLKTE